MLPRVDKVFKSEAKSSSPIRAALPLRDQGHAPLNIPVKVSATDKKIEKFLHESQGGFVSEEYQRRREADVARARKKSSTRDSSADSVETISTRSCPRF